jgi:hypothetical protein
LLVGLVPDLIEKGVAIMQYVDDIVLCITRDPEKANNIKLLLYLFELYQKSEMFPWEEIIILLITTLLCLVVKWALSL